MLRRELGVAPRELALIAAEGESMEPTIRAGELLLFDRSEHGKRPRDGIFIVRLEGSMMVKRLQPMPGLTIAVSSENPAFQPFLIRLDEATDFEILGRVVVVFRRL
jgi:phage repressor protein C with HTH and peptisase S24 domain